MLRRIERKTMIGNQIDMDSQIACLCKGVRTKNTTEGFMIVGKTAFLGVDKAQISQLKNSSAGKWETFNGALRKL